MTELDPLAAATHTLTAGDREVLAELLAGNARRFSMTAPPLAGWYARAAELVCDLRADSRANLVAHTALAHALASDRSGPRVFLVGFDD